MFVSFYYYIRYNHLHCDGVNLIEGDSLQIKDILIVILIAIVAFLIGTYLPFNDPITFNDPSVWLELDIGTYPGLLAGIIIGQVLEKKYVNFNTDNPSKKKTLLRGFLGTVPVIILYILVKAVDNLTEVLQDDILWITQATNFTSYFVIAFCIAFCIPWLFDKIEKQLNFI